MFNRSSCCGSDLITHLSVTELEYGRPPTLGTLRSPTIFLNIVLKRQDNVLWFFSCQIDWSSVREHFLPWLITCVLGGDSFRLLQPSWSLHSATIRGRNGCLKQFTKISLSMSDAILLRLSTHMLSILVQIGLGVGGWCLVLDKETQQTPDILTCR